MRPAAVIHVNSVREEMSVHASDGDRDLEEGEASLNPTEVCHSQIVLPCHSNARQELSVGQLLKWMDSTACLSAERHAGSSCVTASMDDINFERTISVGQVVNITTKVQRAFNTSMEVGILVSCEDLFLDRHWRVCHAYATFVTQRKAGNKVLLTPSLSLLLKPLIPQSHSEQLEYSLAAERRRVRMLHDDIIKDLLSSRVAEPGGAVETEQAVSAVKTKVQSVELVLPPHANHQVNTFGGQIMAWMVNVATIAASRLCQAHPTLRGIDMFKFRGPSQVGDRLLLRAIVNNAFKHSMEVGVRAEAYEAGGPNRHINSAFMIFEVLDEDGNPRLLPRIRPEPVDGQRRCEEATARKKIRLDRKYIISREQAEVPLSVPWDPTNQVYLSYNNVSALKTLAAHNCWRLSSEKDQVRLYTVEHPTLLSFRVEAEVEVPALTAFRLLSELRTRHLWDPHYKECELIRRVDAEDFLYRVVTPPAATGAVGSPTSSPRGEGALQDFILLASQRKPCGTGDPYVIALRSVTLPTHPPKAPFTRGEVLCAGFTILPTSVHTALISYYNQASAELLLPLISTDMAGLSSSFYHNFCACRRYLSEHRDSAPPPPERTESNGRNERNGSHIIASTHL